MNLQELKKILEKKDSIAFELPDGSLVPRHFHVTEIGKIDKNFIDCGGTIRNEKRISFQLWEANDYDHRLHPGKLLSIIKLSQEKLALSNEEIEVEYQGKTIGKYSLEYRGGNFLLKSTTTDCLAKDKCGIPKEKENVLPGDITSGKATSCCSGTDCC